MVLGGSFFLTVVHPQPAFGSRRVGEAIKSTRREPEEWEPGAVSRGWQHLVAALVQAGTVPIAFVPGFWSR